MLLLFPASAKADIETIRKSNSALRFSGGEMLLKYKESVSPIPDGEQGRLPSLQGSASLMTYHDIYFAVEGDVSFNDVNYTGALYNFQTGTTIPYQGTTHENITHVNERAGKGFVLNNSLMLTPYLEIGYRYWNRNLGAGQVENYNNWDILGGGMLQFSPFSWLVLTGYGAAGTTFDAKMERDGCAFNLGSAGMYKAGARIGFNITRHFEIFSTLDYEHLRYVQSLPVADPVLAAEVYEPSSTTNETTVRGGIAYHFW